MDDDPELLFTIDVSEADAPREAQRLTGWLIASGWATATLAPGPRAFATGAVTEQQGGRIEVHPGARMNMQGVDMEGPLCPHCDTQADLMELAEAISDDDPYPTLTCEGCGRQIAFADWLGTAHPIMSNLTIELDRWMINDSPASPPLLAEIREEMGGRWIHMWTHF